MFTEGRHRLTHAAKTKQDAALAAAAALRRGADHNRYWQFQDEAGVVVGGGFVLGFLDRRRDGRTSGAVATDGCCY